MGKEARLPTKQGLYWVKWDEEPDSDYTVVVFTADGHWRYNGYEVERPSLIGPFIGESMVMVISRSGNA